eukprot:scaffold1037_cov157-Amphora_coffeaeformis.AAC.2
MPSDPADDLSFLATHSSPARLTFGKHAIVIIIIIITNNCRCGYSLVFEHLHGVVPTHATVGCTASGENDFSLSIFGKMEKRRADPTLLLVDTSSLLGNKGKGTLHHGGADKECTERLHFMCVGKRFEVAVVGLLHGAARTSL